MATAAKRTTGTRKGAPRKTSRKAPGRTGKTGKAKAAPRRDDKMASAARKAAELLGMDPNEVAATADKFRAQTKQAGQRIKDEVGKLGHRAEELSARFDLQVKQGVKKVEKVADEVAKGLGIRPEEIATKLEQGLDRWSKEATKVAEEANAEIKKMYEQARSRLKEILKSKDSHQDDDEG